MLTPGSARGKTKPFPLGSSTLSGREAEQSSAKEK